MARALSEDRVVSVGINLQPMAAARRNFGTLLIIGASGGIDMEERLRAYTGIDGVAADFGRDAPEFRAAELYFSQSPRPAQLCVGRWGKTPTPAFVKGGSLSVGEADAAAWASVKDGSFAVSVGGVSKDITGLDFSGATNMNGVAAVVSAAALPMKRLKQRPLRKRPKHPKRPKRPLLKLRKLQFPKSRRLKLPIVRKAWRRLKQMKLPRAMLPMVRVAAAPAAAAAAAAEKAKPLKARMQPPKRKRRNRLMPLRLLLKLLSRPGRRLRKRSCRLKRSPMLFLKQFTAPLQMLSPQRMKPHRKRNPLVPAAAASLAQKQ